MAHDVGGPLSMIAWHLAGGSVLALVLAPIVPDEPFHLAGVMVVVGVICAVLGILAGTAAAVRSDASVSPSPRPLAAAAVSTVALIGTGIWFVVNALADLG